MKKKRSEKAVRRNLTFPPSFVAKLEALGRKRGGVSDSEVLRQAINLLEAVTDRDARIFLVDKAGKEAEILVP
jgi:Arc/MetJ-type ribon-helix-helix transcriptional regulator